jgi:hypothetical protein
MQRFEELSLETARHPKVRRVYEYWLGKCLGRAMPRRADFDPLELPDLLGHLCLVEVTAEAPPRFRYRVDGTRLAALTGFDLTGKYADQLPDAGYRAYVLELYGRVLAARAPIFRKNHEEWAESALAVESVTLPLSSDGGRIDALLDAVFATEL